MADRLILDWFKSRGWTPFEFQREVWSAYLAGDSGLIHAATGTGKTYAAWMGPLLEWMLEHPNRKMWAKLSSASAARAVDYAPSRPCRRYRRSTQRAANRFALPWLLESRTGDTSAAVRARQRQRLPTALITTPESLSLLLTRPDAADLFRDIRAVVVDEWHELMATKRGVQTELALARLRRWRPDLRTWGLSATLGNMDVALETLLGSNPRTPGKMIRGAVPKALRIESIIPPADRALPLGGPPGNEIVARSAVGSRVGQQRPGIYQHPFANRDLVSRYP